MKLFFSFFFVAVFFIADSQGLDIRESDGSTGYLNYSKLPNAYNAFISNKSISWAYESDYKNNFSGLKIKDSLSVYDFLISKTKESKFEKYEINWESKPQADSFIAINYIKKSNFKINFSNDENLKLDSKKRVWFHQILFLENFKLKSYIIAAAPIIEHYIKGFNLKLGDSYLFYSNINTTYQTKKENIINSIFLGTTETVIDSTYKRSFCEVKKTFGMSFEFSLFWSASLGINKMYDLIYNFAIKPKDVLNYPVVYFDDANKLGYDEAIKNSKQTAAAFNYLKATTLVQDWYYNPKLQIFFSEIKKVYFFIEHYDDVSHKKVVEKKFRLDF